MSITGDTPLPPETKVCPICSVAIDDDEMRMNWVSGIFSPAGPVRGRMHVDCVPPEGMKEWLEALGRDRRRRF